MAGRYETTVDSRWHNWWGGDKQTRCLRKDLYKERKKTPAVPINDPQLQKWPFNGSQTHHYPKNSDGSKLVSPLDVVSQEVTCYNPHMKQQNCRLARSSSRSSSISSIIAASFQVSGILMAVRHKTKCKCSRCMRDHTLRWLPNARARPTTRSKHTHFVFSTSVRLWRRGRERGKGGWGERRGTSAGVTNQRALTRFAARVCLLLCLPLTQSWLRKTRNGVRKRSAHISARFNTKRR